MSLAAANRILPVPIRVRPGQSLPSYIDTLAYTYRTDVESVLVTLDLTAPQLSLLNLDEDIEALRRLAALAQVPVEIVASGTMARYRNAGVAPKNRARSLQQPRHWTTFARSSGSRFCPACLQDDPLVWKVEWHLYWTFACPIHLCLLTDKCPDCGRIPYSGEVREPHQVDPWRCHHRPAGRRHPHCGRDLRSVGRLALSARHPVVEAQRRVNGMIGGGATGDLTTVVCGAAVPRAEAVLAASQLIRRAITRRLPRELAVSHNLGPPTRIALGGHDLSTCTTPQAALSVAVADAATFAELAAIAVDCLSAPSFARASSDLERYDELGRAVAGECSRSEDLTNTDPQQPVRASIPRHQTRRRSPIVDAIDIAGRADDMTPSDKLAFRTQNAIPHYPQTPTAAAPVRWPAAASAVTARNIPQKLWTTVTDELPRASGKETGALEIVGAMMTVRIGSHQRWKLIAIELGLPSDFSRTANAVISKLAVAGVFDETAYVLDNLREVLDRDPPPIDYARRRWTFRELQDPGRGWRRACRSAGIVATERRRHFLGHALFELLTGGDARYRPTEHVLPAGELRVAYKHFITHESPRVNVFLRRQAEALLLRHRIDEPIDWFPRFELPAGWKSPDAHLERTLPGWNSPSRSNSLRKSSRDHRPTGTERK